MNDWLRRAMPEAWPEATLREVATVRRRTVAVADDAEYLRVTLRLRGQGMIRRDEVLGRSMRVKRQFAIRKDDLVIAEIDAKVGGMAVVPAHLDGAIVSSHYFAFELDTTRVLPGWMSLLCESNHFTRQVMAVGSTNYAAVRPEQVLGYALPLPPLAAQRRIVDLVGAVDAAVTSATREETTTWDLLSAFLSSRVPAPSISGTPIQSLLGVDIGGVWGSEPGVESCDVSVYRSTEFGSSGWATPATAAIRSVSAKQLASRAVRDGDILLEKSGGTPTRPVGRVVRCPQPVGPTIVSNFIQLLRPDRDVVEPSFIYWTLRSWHDRGLPADYQTATTGIRNLRTREYLGLGIDLPSRQEQQVTLAAADALQRAAIAAETSRVALTALRSSALNDLLSGNHEIPASYDRFLEGAA